MKTIFKMSFIMLLLIVVGAESTFSAEYRKLAQTGLKFLSVPLDARSSAMSGAMTSLEGRSTALLFNPAGMARMDVASDWVLGQVRWIGDIDYVFGTAAYSPRQGRYGVFGVSLMSIDYGKMYNTILASNEQGFLDLGEFNPIAYAIGFGYAKALSDKFSVGGQVKYVFQSLGGGVVRFGSGENSDAQTFDVDVFAFDFGILYHTGFKSLNFGMDVRNFAQEIRYIQESFQLPLTFKIGVSMNVLDFSTINPEMHQVSVAIDAVHPRDYVEQLEMGLEYTFMNTFSLRAGYTTPTDEQGISFGAGLQQSFKGFGLGLDYSYTDFGIFNEVQRFTFEFNF